MAWSQNQSFSVDLVLYPHDPGAGNGILHMDVWTLEAAMLGLWVALPSGVSLPLPTPTEFPVFVATVCSLQTLVFLPLFLVFPSNSYPS